MQNLNITVESGKIRPRISIMIDRLLEKQLTWSGHHFSLFLLSGPQGSGKTTLVRHCFRDAHYIGFKDLETRQIAFDNPSSLLHKIQQHPLTILDDVHLVPHLLSLLIHWENRQHQRLVLVSNSKYAAFNSSSIHIPAIRLWPLSTRELDKELPLNINSLLFQGSYPEIHEQYRPPYEWYQEYVRDFIERDLPHYKKLQQPHAFQHFLRVLPHHIGESVNLSVLGNACGVTYNTAKAWLSLLEDIHWIVLLPPYPEKGNKRTVKSPKMYFVDSGLLCHLIGIKNAEELEQHPFRAKIFTSFIVSDLIKQQNHLGYSGPYYFWKDKMGQEIQLILTHQKQVFPIQISSHNQIPAKESRGFSKWKQRHVPTVKDSWIIYTGNSDGEMGGTRLVNWMELAHV